MDAKELIQQYSEGQRDFRGANLFRANLTEAVLDGVSSKLDVQLISSLSTKGS